MIKYIAAVAVLASFATSSANAASVSAEFKETSEGMWELLVDLSGADTTGLATFDFEVVGTPAADVSFTRGKIFGIDPNLFQANGFATFSAGAVGGAGSTRYSVGAIQSPDNEALKVPGIGMMPVVIDGPGPNDFDLGVPALLGTITTPAGLTADNFTNVNFGVIPAAGGLPVLVDSANVSLTVSPFNAIPEPATAGLAGLAIAGALGFRRRR